MSQLDDFEAFMRDNGPMIYSLAVRLCGNRSDGEDLAQETFLKAYEKRDQFEKQASVKTWVFRICVNLWKNRVRYEKRRHFWKHFSIGSRGKDGDQPEFDVAANLPEPGHELEKGELLNRLETALQQLDKDDRAILLLRDVHGETYEDIASKLEIPLGTVRSRLSRCREKLRVMFSRTASTPPTESAAPAAETTEAPTEPVTQALLTISEETTAPATEPAAAQEPAPETPTEEKKDDHG